MKELGRIEFQDLRHKKIAASAHGGSLLQMLKDGEVIAELSYEQALLLAAFICDWLPAGGVPDQNGVIARAIEKMNEGLLSRNQLRECLHANEIKEGSTAYSLAMFLEKIGRTVNVSSGLEIYVDDNGDPNKDGPHLLKTEVEPFDPIIGTELTDD